MSKPRKLSYIELFGRTSQALALTFSIGELMKVLPKKQTLRDISYLVTHRNLDGYWTRDLAPGPTCTQCAPRAGDIVMLVDTDIKGNGPVRVVVLFQSSFFLMPPHLLEKIK